MFKVESNIEDFKKSVHAKFAQLIDVDKVLREAALGAVALISNRVQNHGLNSDEKPIKSESRTVKAHKSNKTGKIYKNKRKGSSEIHLNTPYSQGYAKHRVDKGKEIDIINLTFSSQMMDNFIVAPEGKTGYIVGFRGKTAADKADWNEARFGKIFQLSKNESDKIQKIVTDKINAILIK